MLIWLVYDLCAAVMACLLAHLRQGPSRPQRPCPSQQKPPLRRAPPSSQPKPLAKGRISLVSRLHWTALRLTFTIIMTPLASSSAFPGPNLCALSVQQKTLVYMRNQRLDSLQRQTTSCHCQIQIGELRDGNTPHCQGEHHDQITCPRFGQAHFFSTATG